MILSILSSKEFQKENWQERIKKITDEKIRNYKPTKVLVNHFEDLWCVAGVKYKLEVITNKEDIKKSDLVMIIRCTMDRDNDLVQLIDEIEQDKDLKVKKYRI